MRYRFVHENRALFPVTMLCRVLSVSTSGYYGWAARQHEAAPAEAAPAEAAPKVSRKEEDCALLVRIKAVHERSKGRYGSPRVHAELSAEGVRTSRKRVARLMRMAELRASRPPRRRRTTDSDHSSPVAENHLGRRFQVEAPDRVWTSDITYVETQEGWLYVAVVLDLFSRRIVGWSMGSDLSAGLAVRALEMALQDRRPGEGASLIHHSDRGVQYASGDYQRLLKRHGIVCSMSRRGDCWDNAPTESFFSKLKVEEVHRQRYRTRAEARRSIFAYIEVFYNRERRHSSLGYVSPCTFEQAYHTRQTA